jgi:hypothetical protein
LLSGAALLVALAFGAADDLRVDAGVVAASRASRTSADDVSAYRGEIEILSQLSLAVGRLQEIRVGYSPRLFLPVDLSAGAPELTSWERLRDRGAVRHSVQASASRNLSRISRVAVGAEGTFGAMDLLDETAFAAEAVPTTARIRYLSGEATVRYAAEPTRRTTLRLDGALFAGGGRGAASSATLPFQRGLRLGAGLTWNWTRRDVVSIAAEATGSALSNGVDSRFARLGLSLRHQTSRRLALGGGAGAAVTQGDGSDASSALGFAPWAEAAVSYRAGRALDAAAATRLEPVIDRTSGRVDVRLGTEASLQWAASRLWSLGAGAHAAALRDARQGGHEETLVGGLELRVDRRIGALAAIAAGARSRWQRTGRPDLPTFAEWGVFLEVAARTSRGSTAESRRGVAPATKHGPGED